MQRIFVERCFDGERLINNAEITINRGVIESVTEIKNTRGVDFLPGTLTPGFVDWQVNGGGGKLFCQSPTLATLKTIVKTHRQYGTLHCLPTVITSDWQTMQAAADTVASYISGAEGLEQKNSVLGIHFEGPHLNPERAGIHNPKKLQPLTDQHISLYTRQDIGRVLVTLAPEMVSLEQIKTLNQAGVIVSIGHSNANALQVEQAIEAGARGCTHLFNAMSPFTSRAPGVVGTAMADSRLTAGIIVDGFHVHPTSIKAAFKAMGCSNLCLVTDAMGHAGSDETEMNFENSVITNTNGLLTNAYGTLAGSALTMTEAIKNCVQLCDIPLPQALAMATKTPASWLNCADLGGIKPGVNASMNLLSDEFLILKTW